jgi:DNA-binding response OmpR family regulator
MGSTVLLVEDDALGARAMKRCLQPHNECIVAGSVRAGMNALQAAPRLEGMIVDIGLTDGSGLALARAARNVRPAMPVLIITGDLTAERVNEAFVCGAPIVCKPISRDVLLKSLEPCGSPVTALIRCAQTHPGRWDDALLAFVLAKLDGGELRDILPCQWPDLLDDLANRLRAALPEGVLPTRGGAPLH